MAAIVQQPTQEQSTARTFWNSKMQAHPNIAGALAIALEVAGFFLNGHFLVRLGQWMIRVAGYIAETALLFAVLWVSGTSVAPQLVELVMSAKTMQYFVSVAPLALALIPEIILGNAIVTALGHVQTASEQKTPVAWTWAVLFTLPTVLFLGLTGYTLNALVQSGGNVVQASTGLVGLRCFAGWTYGLLAMVYAGIGRRTLSQTQLAVTPAQPIAPTPQPIDYEEIARQLLPLVAQEVRQIVPDTTGMVEQLHQLRADMEGLTQQSAQLSETIDETNHETEEETNITSFEDAKFHLSQKIDATDIETEEVLTPRITRKLTKVRSAVKRETKSETRIETNNDRGAARQKALRIIKRTPDINAAELAKRAGITPQYAGQILKQQSVN